LSCTITPAGDAATVLYSGDVIVAPGETRTIVAVRSGAAVSVRTTLDLTRPVSGQGQLEIINAAPGAGPLDAFVLLPGSTTVDTPVTVASLPLLAFAAGVAPPNTLDVVFTATATTTPIAGPEPLVVNDGGIYTIYAVDAAGGGAPYQIVFSTN
jgi:hypothetical protein